MEKFSIEEELYDMVNQRRVTHAAQCILNQTFETIFLEWFGGKTILVVGVFGAYFVVRTTNFMNWSQ